MEGSQYRQKALEVNLDPNIYGTFAEIGAGQEVARHFFRAGGAAGTVSKTISAYDMTMSDAIYGKEESGRYVCQPRLQKMLDHEYDLLLSRLESVRHPETKFFTFADTVAAKSYKGTGENHGWMGIKFQHQPKAKPSQVIIHVRMHDAENLQQQEALGLLGLNLIHAVFFTHKSRPDFIRALMDGLTTDRIQIDMIDLSGEAFIGVDSRLYCLELVKNKLCEAALFGPKGEILQASEVLYKKNVLVVRGAFRPPTNLSLDMLESGLRKFKASLLDDQKDNILVLPEISMSLLLDRGDVDNEDFLARVELLSALGQNVLISNSESYSELNMFLTKYAKRNIGFVVTPYTFEELFNLARYKNAKFGILGSLGTMIEPNTKLFVYPSWDDEKNQAKTLDSIKIKPELSHLIMYLKDNHLVEDITDYDAAVTHIWSRKVLKLMQDGDSGWEKLVPHSVYETVKKQRLFGVK